MYNYAEIVFTVNDPDGQSHPNHGFKFGFLFNYNSSKTGWYRVLETDANNGIVEKSQSPVEFFIQYQYQSAPFSRGFQIVASAEYRLRERYKYSFDYSGEMEGSYQNNPPNLVNCFNVFAGIRFDNQKRTYFSKIGIGLRYYSGINPYGQFRSMPHYHQFGLAAIFE
jgi:hypothetical protein